MDVKYRITHNLTLDLSLNTDFAQVEADNARINLTRFSLFFPEKRTFFLERSSNFSFGPGFRMEGVYEFDWVGFPSRNETALGHIVALKTPLKLLGPRRY